MLSPSIYVLTVIIGIKLLASNVSCIRCYVCDVSNCSEINVLNKNQFVKQCSTENVGCITQMSGNTVLTRACETYKGTTCRHLNGYEYCFCDTNLCNGPNYALESDDEELEGGSGTVPMKNDDNSSTEDEIIGIIERTPSSAIVTKSLTLLVCNFIWLM